MKLYPQFFSDDCDVSAKVKQVKKIKGADEDITEMDEHTIQNRYKSSEDYSEADGA